METIFGLIFCVAMIALIFVTRQMRKKQWQKILEQYQEKDFAYTLVFEPTKDGVATKKIILNTGSLTDDFSQQDLLEKKFCVSVKSKNQLEEKIDVTESYFCDIDGNSLDQQDMDEASHIALILDQTKVVTPIFTDPENGNKTWKKDFDFTITHPKFPEAMTVCSDWFSPLAQKFRDIKSNGQIKGKYFIPENAKTKKDNQLFVFFMDPKNCVEDLNIALLCENVTSLVDDEKQKNLDGAFVLCFGKSSPWTNDDLKECSKLFKTFMNQNKNISKDKINVQDNGLEVAGLFAKKII